MRKLLIISSLLLGLSANNVLANDSSGNIYTTWGTPGNTYPTVKKEHITSNCPKSEWRIERELRIYKNNEVVIVEDKCIDKKYLSNYYH